MANQKEIKILKDTYTQTFQAYLMQGSDFYKTLVQGQRDMLSIFLSKKEIKRLENEIRVGGSEWLIMLFESLESNASIIEGKEINIEWNDKGLSRLIKIVNWATDKKEFKNILYLAEQVNKSLNKVA